jgi:hypothetical protein
MQSPHPRVVVVTTMLAALLVGPSAVSQPIQPLGIARPVPPAAPADVAEAPPEATKTPSGLAWKVLSKPRGTTHPGAHDKVTLNFTGWTPQGEVHRQLDPRRRALVVLDG